MMTKAKVIKDLNLVRKSNAKFKSFGMFFLKLMALPVEDQEYITDSLVNASRSAQIDDYIVINDFRRLDVQFKDSEKHFRFILEHEFMCKYCDEVVTEEVNIHGGKFRDVCQLCSDKAYEYGLDALPEVPQDHD